MKTRTYASVSVLAALGLLSSVPAYALGLGNLELSSALNEPFKAEISVTSLGAKEAGNLQVGLASNEEFERAGLIKSTALRDLKFEIVEKNGVTVIAVSSKKPFKEPLVDFLLSATTGTGHLLREYTVLLDPPKSVFRQATVAPTPAKTPAQKVQQSTASSYQYSQPSFSPQQATKYGPVRSNDTLWNIALKTRPEKTITVNQMMMALLKENKAAFINNNINGLKAGVTLAIPTNAEIQQLTVNQAKAAVNEQNALWRNRNRATQAKAADDSANQAVVTTTTDTEETESAQAQTPSEPKSRLKLLSPNEEASSLADDEQSGLGNEAVGLSEQLTLAQQTIEQQAQENIDIKARMAAMEEQIETLRKLIAIDDPEWAKLQSNLEKEAALKESAIDEEDPALTQLKKDIVSALETPEQPQAEVTDADSEVETTDLAANEEQHTTDPEGAMAQEEDDPQAEPAVSEQVQQQAAPKSLLEKAQALIAEYKVEAMSAALVLLIGILLLARRGGGAIVGSGRQKTWDEAMKEIEGDEPLPNFTGGQTREASAVEEDSEVEEIKTVEELIQDADVFTSYGDLAKAKITLHEVLREEPDNQIATHKLLFVLFRQQEKDEFVSLAQKLNVEADSLEWMEVQAWGRELDPENSLFQKAEPDQEEAIEETTNVEPAPLDETSAMEFELNNESATSQEDDVIELDLTPSAAETEAADDDLLNFSTEQDQEESAEEAFSLDIDKEDTAEDVLSVDTDGREKEGTTAEDNVLDFELDLSTDPEAGKADDLTIDLNDIDEPKDETDSGVELQLDELDTVTDEELEAASKALSGDADNEEVELDLGDFDGIDEAETKLDLASAYVDMGDAEGARSILEEVINEGNDDQKARAQAALNDLS